MSCEAQQTAFGETLQRVQKVLKDDIDGVARDTESKTKDLSDKFENDNQLAQGVGATAGTVVGAAVGGAAGAAAGAVVGKAIGAMFTIDIREDIVKFSLDLPEIALKDQEWSLDLPEVSTKDTDIIFNVPTLVMKTVEGPPIPETIVEMVTQCVDLGWPIGKVCTDIPQTTIRWKPTYLDVPTWEDREQRIVIGLPQVTIRTQKIILGIPQVTMKTQEFSFSIPVVTIRHAKDASERLADAARVVATDAATLIAQKQGAFKDRMRQELVGPAHGLFDCHRSTLIAKRDEVSVFFGTQLDTIANSVITLTSNNVPEGDPSLVSARARATDMMAKRDEQLRQFDVAIAKLDQTMKEAIDRLFA